MRRHRGAARHCDPPSLRPASAAVRGAFVCPRAPTGAADGTIPSVPTTSPSTNCAPAPGATTAALHQLLQHAARAVQAVRAGRSWETAIASCPPALRPGAQALGLQALRAVGRAQALRTRLCARVPEPAVDALLLVTLALLTEPSPPYPAHTLVDQSVHAARLSVPRAAGLVNAVLRRCLRERDALLAAIQDDPQATWNHPVWWIAQLRQDWPQDWQDILRAAQRPPPMTLRVHAARQSPAEYVERLREAGLSGRVVGPQAVQLDAPCPVQALPGFAQGDVSVQDLAAQWSAPLLLDALADQTPHGRPWRVLDACAAPGGKTAHLLELAAARGMTLELLALDADEARLTRVRGTLDRIGLAAQVRVGDARDPRGWWDGRPWDGILLDAPCSASGIVRRHPDVPWLRRERDLAKLADTQTRLLDALWSTLAPGGCLVYVTCSVFRVEGQERIDDFLRRHPLAEALPASGHVLPAAAATDASVAQASRIPAEHDGFFHACMRRRAAAGEAT